MEEREHEDEKEEMKEEEEETEVKKRYRGNICSTGKEKEEPVRREQKINK